MAFLIAVTCFVKSTSVRAALERSASPPMLSNKMCFLAGRLGRRVLNRFTELGVGGQRKAESWENRPLRKPVAIEQRNAHIFATLERQQGLSASVPGCRRRD